MRTHIVTFVSAFDKKRFRVTLDEGDVTFLLYSGELRRTGLREGTELSEEDYRKILEEILIPRAKKRAVYYLKNGDRSEMQIRRKLREGGYPPEAAEACMVFLRQLQFADDERLAKNYVNSHRGRCSRRELKAKLSAKGIDRELIEEAVSEITGEDEKTAAEKALHGRSGKDLRKNFAYLLSKGFSYETAREALGNGEEDSRSDSGF